MKNIFKNIFIFYIIILICSCRFIDKGKINLDNAKSLEVGMKSSEVRLIMGQPEDSIRNYFDPSKKIYLYKAPMMALGYIEIRFDNDNKIEDIIFPK